MGAHAPHEGSTLARRARDVEAHPFFEGLTAEALALLAEAWRAETYPAGAFVYRAGDPADRMFFVQEGGVRITRSHEGGGDTVVAELGPGEAFGELGLLDGGPRSSDVHTTRRSELLALARVDFEAVLFLHKDIAYEVLWNAVRRLVSGVQHLV